MRKYKRITEIISFSDDDKSIIENVYYQKEALKEKLVEVEKRISKGEEVDSGQVNSIKVAINYLETLLYLL